MTVDDAVAPAATGVVSVTENTNTVSVTRHRSPRADQRAAGSRWSGTGEARAENTWRTQRSTDGGDNSRLLA
jgi:hypothetical protein